jgi:hypothetical protein
VFSAQAMEPDPDRPALEMARHQPEADRGLSLRTFLMVVSFLMLLVSCAAETSSERELEGKIQLEIVHEPPDLPRGGADSPPRYALTIRTEGGQRPIEELRVLAHTTFAGGIALVDSERRLVAVSRNGLRRVLAEEASAPPAHGPRGELFYVAQKDVDVEVHVIEPSGAHRVLASGLAGAGVLAPRADGTVLFVGARHGGIAGLWRIKDGASLCLTNCNLETATSWGERFAPPPGDAAAIEVIGNRVEWTAHDGQRYTVLLGGGP